MTYLRKPRTRTLNRIATMRRLIAELAKGDMQRKQIEEFLRMVPSGARNYTAQLLSKRIIEVADRVDAHPVYRLIASEAEIEQFLTCMQTEGREENTSATQRRIEKMQKLIEELQTHEMLADEIAWFLQFSPAGARKYIREMREAGVIELARYVDGTATYLGKAVYQICPDQERVKAFLAAICQPKREGAPPRKERPGLREQSMAGRHFHILADDAHYAIRVNRSPVMRDPLVAALFGSGVAGACA